jgi:hypothetical protein
MSGRKEAAMQEPKIPHAQIDTAKTRYIVISTCRMIGSFFHSGRSGFDRKA